MLKWVVDAPHDRACLSMVDKQLTFQRCFGNRTARCSLARSGLLEDGTDCGASHEEVEVEDSRDLGRESLLLSEEEQDPRIVGR